VSVNQALLIEEYPLPTPEELFASISAGKIFSKLELSQASYSYQWKTPQSSISF